VSPVPSARITADEKRANLMRVMEDIRDVRKAMDVVTEKFEPHKELIAMLKSHGVDPSSIGKINDKPIQDYLDEAPLAWDSLVKKMFKKKEEIMPVQMKEMELLKVKLEEFYETVRTFRTNFRTNAPFSFSGSPVEAYKILDQQADELAVKEAEAKRFNELEELFDLQVSKYPETSDTRAEIRLLKNVWDMKSLVLGTFESWNVQLWNEIKTDDLEDVNKNLLKNLRKMANDNPVVKGWQVYRSIEEASKNMTVVLPLINSLHSNAMRDRHWKSLAKVCGVKMIDPNDPKFTFEDAIALNVHKHTEDVEEIIETASKELKIERKLRDIEVMWRDVQMNYVQHHDTEMYLIAPSEEV
jgi:dynein heavy chain